MLDIEEIKNTIICGDCLDVMKEFPDNCINLTVTSPPYDNLRDYNGFTFNFEGIAKELFRITQIGGVVVWVVGDATIKGSETGTSFKQALYFKEIGFNLHDTMIYRKINAMPNKNTKRYRQAFEYMFILCKENIKTFNPIETEITNFTIGTQRKKNGKINKNRKINTNTYRKIDNIFEYGVGLNKTNHPAVFPEQLAKDHIFSWSNENDIILDPFSGSGTTAVVCKQLNRNFIGIELSPEYCKIAEERLKNV